MNSHWHHISNFCSCPVSLSIGDDIMARFAPRTQIAASRLCPFVVVAGVSSRSSTSTCTAGGCSAAKVVRQARNSDHRRPRRRRYPRPAPLRRGSFRACISPMSNTMHTVATYRHMNPLLEPLRHKMANFYKDFLQVWDLQTP